VKMFKAWLWMVSLSGLIIGVTIWLMVSWADLIWLKALIGLVGRATATPADLAALWLTWGRHRPLSPREDEDVDDHETKKKPLRKVAMAKE